MKLYRPFPIDKEMKISSSSMMVTKTDMRGDIIYVNDSFSSIVGYEKEEIIGTPHDALRHPDMPEAIFLLIVKAIEKGDKIRAVVKNLAKSGEYYWAITDFEPQQEINGKVSSFFAFREAVLEDNIYELIELYQILLDIEKRRGVEASLRYLNRYLNENNISYREFMEIMSRPKGLIQRIFIKSFAPKDEDKINYRTNNYKMVA
ncbi:MAG: PAS domain-containing protein [Sulfurovaceae bacterium]|nr:PAS domain-containing protein [Sulfurovaceae bacterium]